MTRWILIERIVWSKRLKVAGKIDRVGVMKGDRAPFIGDIKRGGLYDEIGIQLNAYKMMYNEMAQFSQKDHSD